MSELNNFIVKNSITRSQIINIETFDNGWKCRLFYFKPSILGDDE